MRLPERLLVVAAHPDDEVLGAGGLMRRVNSAGGSVSVLILSEGSTTQYPGRPDLVDQKQREARAALDELGGGSLTLAGLPDMRLSLLAAADVNAPIEAAVADFAPDWVLTHAQHDLNADHRVAHEASRVACRPSAQGPHGLLGYEVPSSTEFGYQPHAAQLFVALEPEDVEAKVAALNAYASEVRPWPHGRSPEAIRAWAAYRGAACGAGAAEALSVIWATAR